MLRFKHRDVTQNAEGRQKFQSKQVIYNIYNSAIVTQMCHGELCNKNPNRNGALHQVDIETLEREGKNTKVFTRTALLAESKIVWLKMAKMKGSHNDQLVLADEKDSQSR